MVRYERETDRYFVIDALSRVPLEGPFARLDFAVGIANSMACKNGGGVWRESIDQNGVVSGPPELITAQQRRFAATTDERGDDSDENQPR